MSIILENLTKRLSGQAVVDRVSLTVEDGELFVLLGASGSGKSTVLRLIAGLATPDSGAVHLHGRDVTALPPQKRGVGYVFQNYSIFRHMTVEENIAFGLKIRRVPRKKRRQRCEELLDLVALAGLGERYERELSGGQRQRVALARALAYEPNVLLLDEPFGALDVKIRAQLRRTLREIQQSLRVTTILVTHDQEEAFDLGRRVGVMERGRLLEIGAPEELYARPRTLHAATFVGSGTVLVGRCRAGQAQVGPLRLEIPPDVSHSEGDRVRILLRPEQIDLVDNEPPAGAPVLGVGEVVEESFAGALRRVRVKLPASPGVRQIAPPLQYGQDGLFVEAALSAGAPRLGQRPWVRLKGWHVLAQPTTSLLVCDRGTGPGRALKMARTLSDALDASVTVLGVASSRSAAGPLRKALALRQKEQGFREADVIVREGDAAEQIASEQAGSRYNLLVVGVGVLGRPRPGRRRSTAQYLLDRVTTPLLIVRGQPKPIERILICTAAGEPGKTGIRAGGWIARRLTVPVTLLYVTAGSDSPPSWVQSHLDRGTATLRDLEVASRVSLRPAKTALDGILAETAAGDFDLIVVGTARPGAGGPSDRFDLTRQILRYSPRSVLVVPEGSW
ncbi:MAG TPA: ATP-binding cassette domain-containing protein [Thermoanaerobaculia bacterium]|nr:ATP-binding cassette domain-containing protein [Thermoanaerobaculia bacterium]